MKMGQASAEAVILFALIGIITFVQFKFQDRWVFYE